MTKTNFWNDAAKYGAFMAIAQILFSTAGLFWRSPLLSFLSVVVIVLMIYFSRGVAWRSTGLMRATATGSA